VNVNGQLKSLWYVGIFTNINPEQNDFYEPRLAKWYLNVPAPLHMAPGQSLTMQKNILFTFELDISPFCQIQIHCG
jgi:hypothetical protein